MYCLSKSSLYQRKDEHLYSLDGILLFGYSEIAYPKESNSGLTVRRKKVDCTPVVNIARERTSILGDYTL